MFCHISSTLLFARSSLLSLSSLQSFQSIESERQVWGDGSSELWGALHHRRRHQHAHAAGHHARWRRFNQLHQLLPGQHRPGVRTLDDHIPLGGGGGSGVGGRGLMTPHHHRLRRWGLDHESTVGCDRLAWIAQTSAGGKVIVFTLKLSWTALGQNSLFRLSGKISIPAVKHLRREHVALWRMADLHLGYILIITIAIFKILYVFKFDVLKS